MARSLTDVSRDAIMQELSAVERDETLARSPMMRRLLRYLVDESLAGRGAKVKSYTVAVEGLGRSQDFDTHTDSYPRVQAGRLRRLLELHYLRHPQSATGIRLQIAPIGYEVIVAQSSASTPEPVVSNEDDQSGAAPAASPQVADRPTTVQSKATSRSWRQRRLPIAIGLLATVLGLTALVHFLLSPLLYAEPVDPGDTPPTLSVVVTGGADRAERDALKGWLLGSLAPSWLFRLAEESDAQVAYNNDRARLHRHYRLSVNIAAGRPANYQFTLVDAASSQVVWSATVPSLSPLQHERTALDPLITRISSPHGAIARQERIALSGSPMGLYHCALAVQEYFLAPNAAQRPIVVACTDDGLRRQPNNIQLLTTKAVLGFNRNDPFSDQTDAGFARSYALVRRAVERDPNDPRTAMIQSRYQFLSGDCQRGIARAEDAIKGWPHSARFWGMTGFYLFECGDPRAEDFVRNAVRLEGRTMSMYESVLVFEALDRGDIAAANGAASNMNATDRRLDMFQALNIAVLDAANGRRDGARRHWAQFARAVDIDPADRDAVFDAYRTGKRQRAIAERYLATVL